MRGFSIVGVTAMVAVLAAQALAPDLLHRYTVELAVVGILVGVPHGAVDHMVPFWTTGTRPDLRSLAEVLGRYLGVAAVAATALLLAPDLAVTAFLLASAAHFGLAENEFGRLAEAERVVRGGRAAPAPGRAVLHAIAHGGAVTVLPLSLWHPQVADVLKDLAPVYAGDTLAHAENVLAVGVLGLSSGLALGALRRRRRAEAAQIALVVAVFVVVPPLAAFAVYFGAWHAIRHTGRLLSLPGPHGAGLSGRSAWRRYAVHAWLPTSVVLVVMGLVRADHSRPMVTAGLAVIMAITFPHLVTVAALDRWAAANRVRRNATPQAAPATPARPSS